MTLQQGIILFLFALLLFFVYRKNSPEQLILNIEYFKLAREWALTHYQISLWLYEHREFFDKDIDKALSHSRIRPLLIRSNNIYKRLVEIDPDLKMDEEMAGYMKRYVIKFIQT